jgi:NAD(P)-dependent dehydrogenase (short-subunit alcohol dehydrogenase family)
MDKPKAKDQAVDKQREIQREQDNKDAAKGSQQKQDKAVQAGARAQPQPPYDEPHHEKPGTESRMKIKPRFDAPDYKGSGKLDGRVAIITGGDSGIGRSVAVLYAREGADVAIVYLTSHEDAQETRRCVEKEGRKCLLIAGDVKDSKFCKEAVDKTVKEFGHLDVLVNNAAFQEHANSIEDITDERLEETFRTNIFGYFYMARAAVPHMKEGSAIVNTTSVVSLRGSKQLLDYSATKGAINSFTYSLAESLIEKGIRVNAVAPGPVWTPLNPADKDPESVKEFGKATVMKRAAQPEELSPAYVFLASPVCSGYITGAIIPVTGEIG